MKGFAVWNVKERCLQGRRTLEVSQPYWSNQRLEICVSGPKCSEQTVVDKPFALLGAHAGCDIPLGPAETGRCSLIVLATGRGVGGLVLSANSRRAGKFFRISDDRPVRVRDYEIRVSLLANGADEQREDAEPPGGVWMASWSAAVGRLFARLPNQRPVLVGRCPPAHVVVADPKMSSVHSCLYRHQDRLWVIDLCSSNGTWRNHRAVRVARLAPDRSVRLAGTSIRFHCMMQDEPGSAKDAQTATFPQLADLDTKAASLAQQQADFERSHRLWTEQQQEREADFLRQQAAHAAREKQWEDDRAVWESTRKDQQQTLAQRERELADAREQQLADLATRRADFDRQADELRQEQVDLEEARRTHEQLQEEERDRLGQLAAELNRNAVAFARVEAERRTTEGEAELEVTHLREQLNEHSELLHTLSGQRLELLRLLTLAEAQMRTEREAWTDEASRLRSEIAELAAQHEHLGHRNHRQDATVETLRAQLAESERQLASLHYERDVWTAKRQQMEARLTERERFLKTSELEAGRREVQLIAMKAQIKQEKSELEDLRRVVSDQLAKASHQAVTPNGIKVSVAGGKPSEQDTYLASADFHRILDQALGHNGQKGNS